MYYKFEKTTPKGKLSLNFEYEPSIRELVQAEKLIKMLKKFRKMDREPLIQKLVNVLNSKQ